MKSLKAILAWTGGKRGVRAFVRGERGIAAVEFAAMMPIVVIFALGTIDLTRYVMAVQKLDRASATLADLTARVETVTEGDVNAIFDAVEQVAQPFDLEGNGIAIISSVVGQGTFATVDWQRTGAGTGTQTSVIGAEGETAVLPAELVLDAGEGVIVSEILFDFQPDFIPELVIPKEIYFQTFARPRRSLTVTME